MKLKPLFCFLLCLLLTFSLAGCRGDAGQESTSYQPESSDTSTQAFGTVEDDDSTTASASSPSDSTGSPSESTESSSEAATETTAGETETTSPYPSYHYEDRSEIVYTTANLNIREAPSTDATVVTVLPKGSSIKRTGYHADWSRLEYNGQTVYAASDYLTVDVPPTEAPTSGLTASNDSLPFGYVREQRDSLNVPLTIYSYQERWGEYADFIQDTSKKVIYLTMDEGYEYGFTPTILDTLKEKNVKAVFFLTGQFVDECPDLVQRMIDEGHIIGNHSTSHPAKGMPSLSAQEQEADIMNLHNKVLNQFGYEMKLFRFPAGTYSALSLELLDSLGYRSVFWSFAYRDFYVNAQPDLTEAMAMCMNELHPGAIYLLHAVSETNTKILGDWIDQVRAQGYEFGIYPID